MSNRPRRLAAILEVEPCYLPSIVKTDDGKGFELVFSHEHKVTFKQLTALAKYFGTDQIDVNSQQGSTGGCESCYESYDELRIQVFGATKHVPVFVPRDPCGRIVESLEEMP